MLSMALFTPAPEEWIKRCGRYTLWTTIQPRAGRKACPWRQRGCSVPASTCFPPHAGRGQGSCPSPEQRGGPGLWPLPLLQDSSEVALTSPRSRAPRCSDNIIHLFAQAFIRPVRGPQTLSSHLQASAQGARCAPASAALTSSSGTEGGSAGMVTAQSKEENYAKAGSGDSCSAYTVCCSNLLFF